MAQSMYGTTFDPESEINRNPSNTKDAALNRYLRLLNTQSTDDLLYGHHLIDRERQFLGLDLQVSHERSRLDHSSDTMGRSGAIDSNRHLRDSLHNSIQQPPLDLSVSVQQRSGVYFDDDFQAAGIVDSTHTSDYSDSFVSQSTLDTVLNSAAPAAPITASQHQTQEVLDRLVTDTSTPETVRARYRLAFASDSTPTNSPFRRTFAGHSAKQRWDPEANSIAGGLTLSTAENRDPSTTSWRRVARTQSNKSSREDVFKSPVQRTTWKQVASARSPDTSQLATAARPETPKRLTSFKQVARSRQNSHDETESSVHRSAPKSVITTETQTVVTVPASNQNAFAALTLPRAATATTALATDEWRRGGAPPLRQNLTLPAPTASRPLPALKFLKQSRRANSHSRISKRFHSLGSGLDLEANADSTPTPEQDAMVKSAQNAAAANVNLKSTSVTWATLTLPRARQNNLNVCASPSHHKPRPVIKQSSSNSSSPNASHLQASPSDCDSSSGVSCTPRAQHQQSAPIAIAQLAADPQDSLVLLTQSSTTAAESERQRPEESEREASDVPPPRKSVSFSSFVRTQTLSPVHRSAYAGNGNDDGDSQSPSRSHSRANANANASREQQRQRARNSNSISDLVRLQIELPPACFPTQSVTFTHPPSRTANSAAEPRQLQHEPRSAQQPLSAGDNPAKRAGSLNYFVAAGDATATATSTRQSTRPPFIKSHSPSADPVRTQMSSGSADGETAARHRGLVLDLQLALDLIVKYVELIGVVTANNPEDRTEGEQQREAGHQAALTRKLVRILMDYLAPALIELLGDGLDVFQLPAPRLTPTPRLAESVWRALGQLLFACFPAAARPPLLRAYNQQLMPANNNNNNNSQRQSESEPRIRLLCFLVALVNAGRLDSFLRALLSELALDALSQVYPEDACVVQCNRAFRAPALPEWLVSLEQRLRAPLAPLPIAAADVEVALSASSAFAPNSTCVRVPHSQTVGDHMVALSTGARATVLSVRQVKALKASRSNRELSGAAGGSNDTIDSGLASAAGGGRVMTAPTASVGSTRATPGPMPMRARHDIDPIRAQAPMAAATSQTASAGTSGVSTAASGRTVLHKLIEKFV